MSAPLYTPDILRLAASIPHAQRIDPADGSAERRSPICGSRVTVDVRLDEEGRVVAIGQQVRACALGQASASLMGSAAIGRTGGEIRAARDALASFLIGERADPGEWPGLAIFAPARDFPARHASIRLAFEALAEAVERASARADAA